MSTGNIERFDLPDGQWADTFRRPSHGQMKEIERRTREAIASDLALQAEDALVLTLVHEWHVIDTEGATIERKREQLDRVPQDTMSLLIAHLNGIIDATRPNDAIATMFATLEGLRDRLRSEERPKMDAALAALREALGVPDPNAPAQTAG